jgi:hypothetical protein
MRSLPSARAIGAQFSDEPPNRLHHEEEIPGMQFNPDIESHVDGDRRLLHPWICCQRLVAVFVRPLRFHSYSEAIMKVILTMALVVGVCGLVGAADKVDPVGTWKCEYDIGGMKRMSALTIKKDGDKLAGTMDWPDQKDEKLKDLKLKDGTLTFSAVRKFMGNEIPIDYTLKVDGDKLKGKGAAEFGGQKQEFDIEGTREKKDK